MTAGVQASHDRCDVEQDGQRCILIAGHKSREHQFKSVPATIGAPFDTERPSEADIASVTPLPPRSPLDCPECGKPCANTTGLAAHRRGKHGVPGKSKPAQRLPAPVALPPPDDRDLVVTVVDNQRVLDVARALAFLDDVELQDVIDDALGSWADEQLKDTNVRDLVRIIRRKRED